MNSQLRLARAARSQAVRRYATNQPPTIPPRAPASLPPNGTPPPLAPGSAPRPVVIVPPTTTPNALPPPPGIRSPPSGSGPKRRPVRRFIIYTSLATLAFYGLSGIAAQHSEQYRDFFTQNIPGGDVVVDYADENDWDRIGWGSVSKKGLQTVDYVKGRFGEGHAPPTSTDEAKGVVDSWKAKAGAAAASVQHAAHDAKAKAEATAHDARVKAESALNKAQGKASSAASDAQAKTDAAAADVKAKSSEAASKAESVLDDAKAKAHELAQRAEAGLKDAKASATELAEDLKTRAGQALDSAKRVGSDAVESTEQAAHNLRNRAEHAVNDAKRAGSAAMTEAERAAHEAELKAKQAAYSLRDRAEHSIDDAKRVGSAAMTEAERAAHDAEAKVKQTAYSLRDRAEHSIDDAKRAGSAAMTEAERAAHDAEAKAVAAGHDVKAKAEDAAAQLKAKADAAAHEARVKTAATAHDAKVRAEKAFNDAKAAATNTKDKLSAEARQAHDAAVSKAEKALHEAEAAAKRAADDVKNVISPPEASRNLLADTARPRELRPETVKPVGPSTAGLKVYNGPPLPLGHEPPPGYYIPRPAAPSGAVISGKDKSEGVAPTLPLLAPKVKEFASSVEEPIIAQLAGTIDSLAASLHNATGPNTANPSTILTKAQSDLSSLSSRLQALKDDEKVKLEKTVEDKKRQFETVLKQKEAEWQGKQSNLKESWEAEREKLVDGWRKVLDGELESQRQGIEKRLREEVISQGIELQRRWLRSIKTQVEQERGGRLSKLDTLSTSLKQLERITLDNSTQLDDNVRLHKLWSALRAVQAKADRGNQRFDDELRVLKSVVGSNDADADKVIQAAVANVEHSGAAQTGVKSLPSLSSWFTQTVSPRIHSVSLVPTEEGQAGVLSHLSSFALSKILFRPQPSLVEGDDVNAVLARAEFYLAEKNLDAAAREVNQLKGWPSKLAADWLREARRRLEVQQALDIVATEATLSSLLLV